MKWKSAVTFLLSSLPLVAQGWVDRTAATGPQGRYWSAMCYDPVHNYVILAGGVGINNGTTSDTWTWDGSTWTARGPLPTAVSAGRRWAMAFDPLAGEVVLVMELGTGSNSLETYTWDGAQWLVQSAPIFTGTAAVTSCYCLAFDHARGQMCLYGMSNGAGWPNILLRNGTNWVSTPLPTRPLIEEQSTSMAWDPASNRIVLTSGTGAGSNRCYEWTGFNWQQRVPTVHPTYMGATVTDTVHGRVIMIEGNYYSVTPNHTWTLANGVFEQLSTPIEPMFRDFASMAFDSSRGVCVLFGGHNGWAMGDTWEFDLGPVAAYSTFGNGCLGSRGVPHIAAQGNSTPRVGSTFTLQANNLPWTGATFLFLGLSNTYYSGTPLPFNLATMGAPNCSVLCSGDQLQVMSTVLGSGSWSWQVPALPGLTFYNQAFALDPTTNALGLVTSNAGTGIIGL